MFTIDTDGFPLSIIAINLHVIKHYSKKEINNASTFYIKAQLNKIVFATHHCT